MNLRLKFSILKSGLSQIQIARITKIQESKLSKIVNGHIEPSEDEKRRVARALNVNMTTIFN